MRLWLSGRALRSRRWSAGGPLSELSGCRPHSLAIGVAEGVGIPTPRRRRQLVVAVLLVIGALAVADASRAPQHQLSARAALGAIHAYQRWLSPQLRSRCRFRPTCSHYAAAVIERRGIAPGMTLTAWRILRCAPWTPAGTVDPPPVVAGP